MLYSVGYIYIIRLWKPLKNKSVNGYFVKSEIFFIFANIFLLPSAYMGDTLHFGWYKVLGWLSVYHYLISIACNFGFIKILNVKTPSSVKVQPVVKVKKATSEKLKDYKGPDTDRKVKL